MNVQLVARNNIKVSGSGTQSIMFAHGFGCDQAMWRHVAPHFADDHRLILFDLVGSGRSDLTAWSPAKYASLDGYAADVIEILDHLSPDQPTVFVGHSVSAMIGVLAAIARPDLFAALVLVAPSPRYLNDGAYRGGFEAADIEELLETLESNYLGWSSAMAPVIMGNADKPELAGELEASFCANDPAIARHFARVTFTGDNRADLPSLRVPTLILQCSDDAIAPESVGRFTHENISGSRFVQLAATGHCPNLSAPDETAAAIQGFLDATPLAL
jgi:sigma-B regulation protein RsbQ